MFKIRFECKCPICIFQQQQKKNKQKTFRVSLKMRSVLFIHLDSISDYQGEQRIEIACMK